MWMEKIPGLTKLPNIVTSSVVGVSLVGHAIAQPTAALRIVTVAGARRFCRAVLVNVRLASPATHQSAWPREVVSPALKNLVRSVDGPCLYLLSLQRAPAHNTRQFVGPSVGHGETDEGAKVLHSYTSQSINQHGRMME